MLPLFEWQGNGLRAGVVAWAWAWCGQPAVAACAEALAGPPAAHAIPHSNTHAAVSEARNL